MVFDMFDSLEQEPFASFTRDVLLETLERLRKSLLLPYRVWNLTCLTYYEKVLKVLEPPRIVCDVLDPLGIILICLIHWGIFLFLIIFV